jgi:two-component system, NarL family, nitrate/nitrite response regulator NarP
MSVVVCCKDPLSREALQSLLRHEGGFEVLGAEQRVTAALSAAKVQKARAVVVDASGLNERDMDRLSAARARTSLYIVLLAEEEPEVAAHGKVADRFVQRSKGSGTLFKAVGDIVNRNRLRRYSLREERRLLDGSPFRLTPREYEVAKKVAEGLSNRDIAESLGLAEQTVKNLVSVIMRKLNCRNRVQVALRLAKADEEKAAAG